MHQKGGVYRQYTHASPWEPDMALVRQVQSPWGAALATCYVIGEQFCVIAQHRKGYQLMLLQGS
jgi:hypothetical protein